MTEVYDLDAVAAEATQEPLRFTWHGQEWTLAHMTGVDWRVVELAGGGDVEAIRQAFKLGMGDEQAARFAEVPQPIGAMTKLFGKWLEHNGMSEGKSPVSDDSSETTAQPSTRASKPTTGSRSATSSKAASRRAGSPT